MARTICSLALGMILFTGVARAEDPSPPKPTIVEVQRVESSGTSCDACEDHGFFHPLQHFWGHKVGHQVKCAARQIKHGIGGGSND